MYWWVHSPQSPRPWIFAPCDWSMKQDLARNCWPREWDMSSRSEMMRISTIWRELGTKNIISFCVNFKIETQIHYFLSASQICFIYCVTTCTICNVQYSVLYSHRLSLIPSYIPYNMSPILLFILYIYSRRCPIAHVTHCSCASLPKCPIPFYPIPCSPYPCTPLSLSTLPLYPITLCAPIANMPHCPCAPSRSIHSLLM